MPGSTDRVMAAFAHRTPDRTPLFEIFKTYHPLHWPICGRTIGTDKAMCWDALADGVAWEELLEAHAQAAFQVSRFFGLDMVLLGSAPGRGGSRPVKTGPNTWTRDGRDYVLNERTKYIELAHPGEADAYSRQQDESAVRALVENWDGTAPDQVYELNPLEVRVRELAESEGLDWIYMAEIPAGTGTAFYPTFMLMWTLTETDLYERWLQMQKAKALAATGARVSQGHRVIVMGGDVACDKGPFISPAHYRDHILPVVQEHVRAIHDEGALAVYTSDGNLWQIKDDLFFHSGADGYKEVDNAAGMAMERLVAEGIKDRVCIIGNIDARHTLCGGTPEDARTEVFRCLREGQKSPGGHILHSSNSIHEDVKTQNYTAAVNAYREYFGMEPLPL